MANHTEITAGDLPLQLIQSSIDKSIDRSSSIISARIDGIEKAIHVFQTDLTRVPTAVDRAVNGLHDVVFAKIDAIQADINRLYVTDSTREHDIKNRTIQLHELLSSKISELSGITAQKFSNVDDKFSERDARASLRANDTREAVDAAFSAAKENTAKIETSFTKQIDSIVAIIDSKTGNLAGAIGDLKERMTTMEARTQGIGAARTEIRETQSDSRATLLSVISIVISIATLAFLILARNHL